MFIQHVNAGQLVDMVTVVMNLNFIHVEGYSDRKKDEVAGSRRKLHNEELHNLYSSPSITRMIKSRSV
jgi:hypothetical protein